MDLLFVSMFVTLILSFKYFMSFLLVLGANRFQLSASVSSHHLSLEVMEKWSGKIAVVTGASAGIGAEIVKDLAKIGVIVIGLARRPEKIEEIAKSLGKVHGQIHAFKCDVSDIDSIKTAFKWIESTFGFIHILVNNAGVIRKIKILTDDDVTDKINEVINTNFSGLVHVTREAFKLMKKSNDYGIIVNINSNAGHKIPFPVNTDISHNVYHGSKFAVTATSEVSLKMF
jgi:NADP+-dependent farnesol dehydrogenase